jgi:REP element-mobilizing transposase RayT
MGVNFGDVPEIINFTKQTRPFSSNKSSTMPRGARLDSPGTLHHVIIRVNFGDVPEFINFAKQTRPFSSNKTPTMPRGARLDSPGTLHHVIIRGIEKRAIVNDDDDRTFFISRMGAVASKTGTTMYAWALMTNHAHMLLRSGTEGLSAFMRKFLTGYSVYFNRKHKRHGHLFQNRYKSIVCEEESYFLKLVSYIHLNPLRAGMVESVEELGRYPWSGHEVLMGRKTCDWQDADYVLGCFGKQAGTARKEYIEFMQQESRLGQQPNLVGGGLIRSAGGWSEVMSLRRRGNRQFSDERILGSGEFAQEIIDEADASVREKVPLSKCHREADELVERTCERHGTSRHALESGGRSKVCSTIRKELALKLVFDMGLSYAESAPLLGISASAICQIIRAAGNAHD